jgi:holo-[acyl-carrier protein] synthase
MSLTLPNCSLTGNLIGTDVVDIDRVAKLYTKYRKVFLDRVFTAQEAAYCLKFRDPAPSLAARFAAKEAASKALGVGIGEHLGWQSISVAHDALGAPYLVLDPQARLRLHALGASVLRVSLAHSRQVAIAFVMGG